jgi:hypothetical protein
MTIPGLSKSEYHHGSGLVSSHYRQQRGRGLCAAVEALREGSIAGQGRAEERECEMGHRQNGRGGKNIDIIIDFPS